MVGKIWRSDRIPMGHNSLMCWLAYGFDDGHATNAIPSIYDLFSRHLVTSHVIILRLAFPLTSYNQL
jgi:hypothetical protein